MSQKIGIGQEKDTRALIRATKLLDPPNLILLMFNQYYTLILHFWILYFVDWLIIILMY